MTEISRIDLWQVLDSRGNPTVAARVHVGTHSAVAIAPSGASTGTHEALFLRDGGTSFNGLSVNKAIERFAHDVIPSLIGIASNDFSELNRVLRSIDTTPTLSRFGGHIPVAISIATWLAYAKRSNSSPHEVISAHSGVKPSIPMPMVNIFSGGAHAGGAIDIQDILAIPTAATSFEEALEWVWLIREETKKALTSKGFDTALVADEGGLTARLESDELAIAIVADSIERSGLSGKAHIALDIAASQLYVKGKYQIHENKGSQSTTLDSEEFVARWSAWLERYPIISVEDGAAEEDEVGWQAQRELTSRIQIIGDDRYCTQTSRLTQGIQSGEANSILIKPNQAGTLYAALTALKSAKKAGWNTIVSARSGETEESWLADLAVGSSAGQIKVGSTHRSERTAKWNRLLEISQDKAAPFNSEKALDKYR